MMNHEISEDTLNKNIEYCIDQYVRLIRNRELLRDRWFCGLSFENLAEKYDLSVTAVKSIVYGKGDKVLIRASKMK